MANALCGPSFPVYAPSAWQRSGGRLWPEDVALLADACRWLREKVASGMRIFLGIKDVSGVAWRIRCGLRDLGIESDLCNLYPYRHADICPSDLPMPVLMGWMHRITHALHIRQIGGVRRFLTAKVFTLLKAAMFVRACARYDAFIYFGGVSFFDESLILNRFHLWILRRMGKKVVVFLFGSEARPDYMDGVLSELNGLRRNLARKRAKLTAFENHGCALISPSSCAQLYRRPFINLIAFGLPHPTPDELFGEDGASRAAPGTTRPVVLHAPSELALKGTAEIRSAVIQLKEEGLDFEYAEVSGLPRRDVLKAIKACDFVIDQMYSDYPLASFATEAAYFGKPSVVGGYYASTIHSEMNASLIPPSLYIPPEDLKDAVRRMITDTDLRTHLSQQVQNYARENANPRIIAERLMAVLSDQAPREWQCDPMRTRYFHGLGIEKRRLRTVMSKYVSENGPEGLMVSDKPDLERDMIAFINRHDISRAQ